MRSIIVIFIIFSSVSCKKSTDVINENRPPVITHQQIVYYLPIEPGKIFTYDANYSSRQPRYNYYKLTGIESWKIVSFDSSGTGELSCTFNGQLLHEIFVDEEPIDTVQIDDYRKTKNYNFLVEENELTIQPSNQTTDHETVLDAFIKSQKSIIVGFKSDNPDTIIIKSGKQFYKEYTMVRNTGLIHYKLRYSDTGGEGSVNLNYNLKN